MGYLTLTSIEHTLLQFWMKVKAAGDWQMTAHAPFLQYFIVIVYKFTSECYNELENFISILLTISTSGGLTSPGLYCMGK